MQDDVVEIEKTNSSKKVNREIKLWSLILIIFATAFIFIYSSYAWFRATLRVEIHELNIISESDNDMVISLNGIDWGSEVTINKQTIINDLKKTYETHYNQWPNLGLFAISSNGLNNVYSNSFALYDNINGNYKKKNPDNKAKLELVLIDDKHTDPETKYVAFDLFIKNGTPSPFGDNLYVTNDTFVKGVNEDHNQNVDSMRIGFSFTPFIDRTASIADIQALSCAPGCSYSIYEPNSISHTDNAILEAREHQISIRDGQYYPTYAVIKEGNGINVYSGVYGSDHELDLEHFALQETITDETKPVTIIREGITKARVFIWIEAQDIDTIEHYNLEDSANINIIFRKEMIK